MADQLHRRCSVLRNCGRQACRAMLRLLKAGRVGLQLRGVSLFQGTAESVSPILGSGTGDRQVDADHELYY